MRDVPIACRTICQQRSWGCSAAYNPKDQTGLVASVIKERAWGSILYFLMKCDASERQQAVLLFETVLNVDNQYIPDDGDEEGLMTPRGGHVGIQLVSNPVHKLEGETGNGNEMRLNVKADDMAPINMGLQCTYRHRCESQAHIDGLLMSPPVDLEGKPVQL